MFNKQHRFTRLAAAFVAAAVLLPVAQAGAQASSGSEWGEYGMPRAMPSDTAAYFAQIEPGDYGILPATPRGALPSDYGTQIQPGDYGILPAKPHYGMPRAMPADYEPVGTSGGNGFDWADAGIGAGAAFGLVLVALAATVTLRGGRKLEQA